VKNRPFVKFIRNYIRDSSGVFSISLLVRISMTSFSAFTLLFVRKYSCLYHKKKTTRQLQGKISILFSSGEKQYFTHALGSLVKYCFYHSKIKFISSSCRVISSIYYIDKSVLVENRPLVKFIRNYIRDSSGVFSIS